MHLMLPANAASKDVPAPPRKTNMTTSHGRFQAHLYHCWSAAKIRGNRAARLSKKKCLVAFSSFSRFFIEILDSRVVDCQGLAKLENATKHFFLLSLAALFPRI